MERSVAQNDKCCDIVSSGGNFYCHATSGDDGTSVIMVQMANISEVGSRLINDIM